jgi:hypothetical protein
MTHLTAEDLKNMDEVEDDGFEPIDFNAIKLVESGDLPQREPEPTQEQLFIDNLQSKLALVESDIAEFEHVKKQTEEALADLKRVKDRIESALNLAFDNA